MIEVILKDIPKVTYNTYVNWHWSKRKKFKDALRILMLSQNNIQLDGGYDLTFLFEFKGKKLDSVNAFHYCKVVEDFIFKQDNENGWISSKVIKGKENKMTLRIVSV